MPVPVTLMFWFLAMHALCDYPLQGDFMARGKSNKGVQPVPWWHLLSAHALIHGGGVAVVIGGVTGDWSRAVLFGLIETPLHFGIDEAKSRGWTNIHADQLLHVACKAAYTAAVCWG